MKGRAKLQWVALLLVLPILGFDFFSARPLWVHPTGNMMAGNRHAGAFVIAFAVALLCLSLLAVIRTHWKTRQPVPQKSITGSLFPSSCVTRRSASLSA